MTCVIIGLLVSCASPTPRPAPEVAAAILRASVPPFVPGIRGIGPRVTIAGWTRDTPPAPPTRRLDGTLLTDPVTVYGNPFPMWRRRTYEHRPSPRR